MQPSFIPTPLVDKILFVGKAVQLLSNQVSQDGDSRLQVTAIDNRSHAKSGDGTKKVAQLSEVSEFNKKLQMLKSHLPFHAPSFEHVYTTIVSCVVYRMYLINHDVSIVFQGYRLLPSSDLFSIVEPDRYRV